MAEGNLQWLQLDADAPGFDAALAKLTALEASQDATLDGVVAGILADVRARGDAAVLEYTRRFDRLDVASMQALEIPPQDTHRALAALDTNTRDALEQAAQRIRSYHQHQRLESWQYTEADGTVLGQRVSALDRVGLYVPGGKAAYPSSLLMNAIPARVAGVERLVVVTPTPKGQSNPMVLAAAHIAGVERWLRQAAAS